MKDYSMLPSINSLLNSNEFKEEISQLGRERVKGILSESLTNLRNKINEGAVFTREEVYQELVKELHKYQSVELKALINGTGTLLHTNLGRAVLSKKVMEQVTHLMTNYVNVEFDLTTGKRGKRGENLTQLLCNLTNAESALVVNNNASAVYLILNEFAHKCEVLVSRGELVEIGGSFRVPDIMRLSGANLKEVGTTNKTKLSDYDNNITDYTSMIMKVHQSNFQIVGFTEEADIADLIPLAKDNFLISYYDLGSGLIHKLNQIDIPWDHSVKEVIDLGVDLVSFSGDKLLGATQAGLIVGKKEYIDRLKKNPLYRILRVGKLTDSVLYYTLKNYLDFEQGCNEIPFFKMLQQTKEELEEKAYKLESLIDKDIKHRVTETKVRTGGGSMPGVTLDSFALQITEADDKNAQAYLRLLDLPRPIVAYLTQGKLNIDLMAIYQDDFNYISNEINKLYLSL